ncbi:hypothetical protein WKI68_22480 [Streptomyces sp. MS1.HAVA.3]|uniref:Uncharacterized protein n=1 Tax=Streptomyces caledonius TaxID=3134107 RepID=A0ABU8U8D6_9ACTN
MVQPYSSTRVKVGGNGGIPAGITAVVLNVTVTDTRSDGHIIAFPEGTERPTTSNVNFKAGQTVPNLVIVPVGKNGYVELANRSSMPVNLIADVTGYFSHSASSGYTPVARPASSTPARASAPSRASSADGRPSPPRSAACAGCPRASAPWRST